MNKIIKNDLGVVFGDDFELIEYHLEGRFINSSFFYSTKEKSISEFLRLFHLPSSNSGGGGSRIPNDGIINEAVHKYIYIEEKEAAAAAVALRRQKQQQNNTSD